MLFIMYLVYTQRISLQKVKQNNAKKRKKILFFLLLRKMCCLRFSCTCLYVCVCALNTHTKIGPKVIKTQVATHCPLPFLFLCSFIIFSSFSFFLPLLLLPHAPSFFFVSFALLVLGLCIFKTFPRWLPTCVFYLPSTAWPYRFLCATMPFLIVHWARTDVR
uniref:Uncharacterized protein n=1 Tax=Trypanosoma vivax (strain Y486) TaxID=1055687 RepID=G0TXV3_TRYVY|nr:hypothetical protein TVY486_0701320 [Trypanosoma vivax Y486]